MRHTFGQLCIGDMFNIDVARCVKTSETEAIVVMSALRRLGTIWDFHKNTEVVLLWSAVLATESDRVHAEMAKNEFGFAMCKADSGPPMRVHVPVVG